MPQIGVLKSTCCSSTRRSEREYGGTARSAISCRARACAAGDACGVTSAHARGVRDGSRSTITSPARPHRSQCSIMRRVPPRRPAVHARGRCLCRFAVDRHRRAARPPSWTRWQQASSRGLHDHPRSSCAGRRGPVAALRPPGQAGIPNANETSTSGAHGFNGIVDAPLLAARGLCRLDRDRQGVISIYPAPAGRARQRGRRAGRTASQDVPEPGLPECSRRRQREATAVLTSTTFTSRANVNGNRAYPARNLAWRDRDDADAAVGTWTRRRAAASGRRGADGKDQHRAASSSP